MISIFQEKSSAKTDFFLIFTYVIYVFVTPAVVNSGITNFMDAADNLGRTSYVMTFGHSNPSFESYFDMQPGFFYFSTIFLQVTGIDLFAYVKFFSITFFSMMTLALYVFYRKFLNSSRYALLAIFVFFTFYVYSTGHYSAQDFTLPLYVFALYFLLQYKSTRANFVLSAILFTSIVFLHQGITAWLLLNTLGISLLAFFWNRKKSEILGKSSSYFSASFLSFLLMAAIWASYLVFMTISTFESFSLTLRSLFEYVTRSSLISEVSSQIYRPIGIRQSLIYLKLGSTAFIYFIGFIGIFYMTRKKELYTRALGLMLLVVLLSDQILGLEGIQAQSGSAIGIVAGMVPRVVIFSLIPLSLAVCYILAKLKAQKRKIVFQCLVASILVFSMLTPLLVHSNVAFEFVSQSDAASSEFAATHSRNVVIAPRIIVRMYLPEFQQNNLLVRGIEAVFINENGSLSLTEAQNELIWLSFYRNWYYINQGAGDSYEQCYNSMLNSTFSRNYDNGFSAVYERTPH
jgi:hypothetical protein